MLILRKIDLRGYCKELVVIDKINKMEFGGINIGRV